MHHHGTPFPHIAERFLHQVDNAETLAGRELLLFRRVQIVDADIDRLVTLVRVDGEKVLQVRLSWAKIDQNIVEATCPCSQARQRRPCRHIWASILLFELQEGRIPGRSLLSLEISEEPLPLPELRRLTTLNSGLKHFFYHYADDGQRTSEEVAKLTWREEFQRLKEKMEPRLPRLEVDYDLDMRSSRQGQLFLTINHRATLKSGELGVVKQLKISQAEALTLPDPIDREILPLLLATTTSGRQELRYNSRSQQARRYVGGFIPALAYRTALPLLCSSGRFRWHRGDHMFNETVELAWDEAPWRFVLGVEPHEGFAEGRVHGLLERSGPEGLERRPLAEADLVLSTGLVLLDGTFSPLQTGDAGAWIDHLRERGDLLVPRDKLPQFVEALHTLPTLPALELPPELSFEQIAVTPQRGLTCRLRTPAAQSSSDPTAAEGGLVDAMVRRNGSAALRLEAFFVYDGLRVEATAKSSGILDRAGRRMLVRDPHFEQQALAELVELGPARPVAFMEGVFRLAAKEFSDYATQLLASGWRVEAEGQPVRQAGSAQWSIQSGIDWFELHGDVDFEGVPVSTPALLRAIRRGERLVRLGDGTQGMLPENWLKRFGPLAQVTDPDTTALRPAQAVMVDLLLAEMESKVEVKFEVDTLFDKLRRRLRSFDRVKPCAEPEGFLGELRPYQQEGLGWLVFLRDLGFGGCLADDMGLGKTVQVLALLALHHLGSPPPAGKEAPSPSLIVVPRSLITNWKNEAERFTPGLRLLDITSLTPAQRGNTEELLPLLAAHDVALTTYGLLRRNVKCLADGHFSWVILDEAQAIKNFKSQAARASRLLRAGHRLALTGTPVENHLGDLGSLFEFLNPGMLGRSLLRPAADGDQAALRLLIRAIRPFLLRRTKEEVLKDLPPKTEQTLYCEPSVKERREYEELREHYRVRLDQQIRSAGLAKSKILVLEALLRLRQAACHPGLLSNDRIDDPSAKMNVLFEQLEEVLAEGHKALVFSQFVSLLTLVRRQLDERGIAYEYLDGSTRDRGERVEHFQKSATCQLFLISLKAGGLGLNLTAADYVFILDPWWNPAVEAQAVDRAHRIGQARPVFAYRLVTRGTVEEKILTLQDTKRQLADALLADRSQGLRQLTEEDLEMLFS